MAMIMYCWHALKLEGVYRAVAQPCVDQMRHNIYTSGSKKYVLTEDSWRCYVAPAVTGFLDTVHNLIFITERNLPEPGSLSFLRGSGGETSTQSLSVAQ
jgi:hypothetical protein